MLAMAVKTQEPLANLGRGKKAVTLAAARDLAEQLAATGKVQPILARRDDRYLRLRERIRLARRQQSDVLSRFMRTQLHQKGHAAYLSLLCPTQPRTKKRRRWPVKKIKLILLADPIWVPKTQMRQASCCGCSSVSR